MGAEIEYQVSVLKLIETVVYVKAATAFEAQREAANMSDVVRVLGAKEALPVSIDGED